MKTIPNTALIIFILCQFLIIPTDGHTSDIDCSVAMTAANIAGDIRGLPLKSEVPCRLMTKEQVGEYIRTTVNKKISVERIANEELLYRTIGFIPEDYDYVNGLIKLYTEQVGGFYDPDENYYAMASWMPLAMQLPIAVHELTHAIQDQYFNLDTIMDHEHGLTDELMARSAVVEGEATAVMVDYSKRLSRQPPLREDKNVSVFLIQNLTGAMFSSSLHNAPPALQTMIIFPYLSGLHFAHSLLVKGGYDEITNVYKKLPKTTEEILHPHKYWQKKSDFVELNDEVPSPYSDKYQIKAVKYSDRLGEFFISTLLSVYVPTSTASKASSGWGGDRIVLYELDDSGELLGIWKTNWDSLEDAEEFKSTIITAYRKRFGFEPVATDLGDFVYNLSDGKKVRMHFSDKAGVIVFEGLKFSAANQRIQ